MGWRYRRSMNIGPFRLNFSKNGIGYSVGSKYFRVTKKADGGMRTTSTLPGLHMSKVTDYGASQIRAAKTSRKAKSKKGSIVGGVAALLLIAGALGSGGDKAPDPQPDPVAPVVQEQVDEQSPKTDESAQPDKAAGEIDTQTEPDPTPAPDPVVDPEPDPKPTPEPQPVTTPEPTPQPEPEPQPEQAEPAPTLTPEQAFRESLKQYAYVGSSESDKYHQPTCRWTSKINDGNLVHFDSAEEAQAAGYEPCGTCNPK